MGIEPPFIYDRPSKYSFTGPTEKAFNPKAASHASWSPPPRPRPKSEGPLINSKEFNRHPDSYFVVPYGNLDWKPMSPRTKLKVKYVRWLQLFFRLCALAGALGMLFCVICIKSVPDSTGWIMRVPPGIAILHTVYGIYHLVRPAKGRTPTSSASYMLFAAIIDVGLIPFFVFTAMMARTQYTEPGDTHGHWATLFGSAIAEYKIVFSLFLVSVVNGSVHLVSLSIDIYLALIFRKISSLPPDMNPLEDNLTSRHKRNKSSLLDNRSSQATTSTASPNRESHASDPLISPPRTVPFMHTRNDSYTNITDVPHPTSNHQASRTDLQGPFYDQALSQRSSRANITHPTTNNPSFYNQPQSQRSSRANLPPIPTKTPSFYNDRQPNQNASAADITRSPTKSSSVYSDSTTRPSSTRPPSTVSDTNWITHPSPPIEFKHLRKTYTPLPQSSPFDNENFLPRPLEMNPPTPPNAQWRGTQQRPLAPATGNGSFGGGSVGSLGIGKARGYGNLGAGSTNMGARANTGGGRVLAQDSFNANVEDDEKSDNANHELNDENEEKNARERSDENNCFGTTREYTLALSITVPRNSDLQLTLDQRLSAGVAYEETEVGRGWRLQVTLFCLELFATLTASASTPLSLATRAGPCPSGPSINEWAALGDSLAAGPGAGVPYDSDTVCKRYSEAYPLALSMDQCMPGHDDPTRKPNFIACSGAVIQDVLTKQVPNVQQDTDMVTLSIGGSDLGIEAILDGCIFQFSGSSSPVCTESIAAAKTAISSAQFEIDWANLINAILGKLSISVSNAIFVAGYTNFFSEDLSSQCESISFSYSPSNQPELTRLLREQLNELLQTMNWYLHYYITQSNKRLGANKVVFVDYNENYNGHRFCRPTVTEPDRNNPDTWFLNLDSAAQPTDQVAQNFRPTPSGHAGIKDAVLERLLGLPALDGLNLRIVPLGDSITYGFQSSDGNGYRQYLLTLLAGNNVNFVGSVQAGTMTNNNNEGHSGAIIDQIASYAYLSLPERPNVVLLMAGTNDMNNDVDPDNAAARLGALIDEIFAACPDTVVIVAQIIPAANPDTFARLVTYNARISLLVNQQQTAGKHVIKAWMPLTTDDLIDGLHPTDMGYSKMADGWLDALVRANAKGWIGQPVVVNNTGKQPCTHSPNWISQGTISPRYGGGQEEIRFADLNSDGRAEYLWIHPDSSVDAWLNLGGPDNGPNAAKVSWQPQGVVATGVGASGSEIQFADLNGDQRADYLWVHADGSVDAWLNLAGPGDGPSAVKVEWVYQGNVASGLGQNGSEVRFADLNGDGKAEYLWVHPDGSVDAWLNLGSSSTRTSAGRVSWQSLGTIATGIGKSSTGLEFGDINGDARADYLWVDPSNSAVTAYLNGGGPANSPNNTQIYWNPEGIVATGVGTNGSGVRFADLNGDGRVEYLNVNANGAVDAWLNAC